MQLWTELRRRTVVAQAESKVPGKTRRSIFFLSSSLTLHLLKLQSDFLLHRKLTKCCGHRCKSASIVGITKQRHPRSHCQMTLSQLRQLCLISATPLLKVRRKPSLIACFPAWYCGLSDCSCVVLRLGVGLQQAKRIPHMSFRTCDCMQKRKEHRAMTSQSPCRRFHVEDRADVDVGWKALGETPFRFALA